MRSAAISVIAVGIAVSVGAFVAARPPPIEAAPERIASLEGVTLVEPGVARAKHRTLHFEAGTIRAIEPAKEAEGTWAGHFVLPGLTDTHLHMPMLSMPGDAEYTALLLLSHGVTTARLLGGTSAADVAGLNRRIEAGEIPGPRLLTCGPILDGPDPVLPGHEVVLDGDAARETVARLAAEGVDCIKAYDGLSLETVTALREAAHAAGLSVIGHTPQDVRLEDARLDDVQHLRGVHPPFEDEGRGYPDYLRPWLRHDDARLAHVISVSRANAMAYTPTLVAIESMLRARNWSDWRAGPAMQAWPSHLREGLFSAEVGVNPGRFLTDEQATMVGAALEAMARTTLRLHEAGLSLHTGTDSNAPNVVPGFALHRELALWVEAGITPRDALAASTGASARTLGARKGPRLAVGAPADLVIFREDPTQDIRALSTIVAVVRDGRLFSRAELDQRVARYREHYEAGAYRLFVVGPLRLLAGGVTAFLGERGAATTDD